MLAKAVVLVKAVFADVNTFAVSIDDFPSFGTIVLALLAEFGIIVAVVAEKFGRKFARTGNANTIGADLEDLEVVGMVLANGNLGVEVRVNPIDVTAKTIAASNANVISDLTL